MTDIKSNKWIKNESFHQKTGLGIRLAGLGLCIAILFTGSMSAFSSLQKKKQLDPSSTNKWVKKVHTAFGELPVFFRSARLFPRDAVYCFFKYAKGQLK